MIQTDVLIVGCGVAGCTAALELAKQGIEVTIVSAAKEARHSSSFSAGKGIIYPGNNDSPEQLTADIQRVGAGLCHPRAVEQLVTMGPKVVDEILVHDLQVEFEQTPEGKRKVTGGHDHSVDRILYFRDHTGKVIIDGMLRKIAELPNVTLLTDRTAIDLITLSHHSTRPTDVYKKPTCAGAYVLNNETGEVDIFFAKETILATGGVSEVFLHATNSPQSRGDGIAMGFRAGARIMNMEYIQFHPTALSIPNEPRYLLTESLYTEGAVLLDHKGQPFMERYHEAGCRAPSDVIARAMYLEMLSTGADHVWLDITNIGVENLKERFPNIYDYCRTKGFDMANEPLPVVPAAHYGCGGIAVDRVGQTTLQRLRAIGEVACTGVHGADRLSSTSLIEGMVWGKACADDISKQISKFAYYFPTVDEWVMSDEIADPSLIRQDWMSVKQTMWNYVGLVRDERRLRRALRMLRELRWEVDSFYDKAQITPEVIGLRNGVLTALLITQAAAQNRRSSGSHRREPMQPATQTAPLNLEAVLH